MRRASFYSYGTVRQGVYQIRFTSTYTIQVFKVLKDDFEQTIASSTSNSIVTDEIIGQGRAGAPAVQQALWFLVIGGNDKYCDCLSEI